DSAAIFVVPRPSLILILSWSTSEVGVQALPASLHRTALPVARIGFLFESWLTPWYEVPSIWTKSVSPRCVTSMVPSRWCVLVSLVPAPCRQVHFPDQVPVASTASAGAAPVATSAAATTRSPERGSLSLRLREPPPSRPSRSNPRPAPMNSMDRQARG